MEARLAKLLEDAPGPAPWYWRSFPSFRRGGETWSWEVEPKGHVGEWPALRRRSDGARCFLPGFYCYAVDAGNGRLLAWRSQEGGAVEIALHDVDRLDHVEIPNDHPRRDRDTYAPGALEGFRMPPLAPGTYEGYSPHTPVELDELLLLTTPAGPEENDPALAITAWEPRTGRVTVSPQPWFTAATHDLGYEWVTKVARDPESGRVIGAGIRIRAFELEDDATTVRRWLTDA